MALIFSTTTHRFHPQVSSRPIHQDNENAAFFGNDVIFRHHLSQCPIIVNNQ